MRGNYARNAQKTLLFDVILRKEDPYNIDLHLY